MLIEAPLIERGFFHACRLHPSPRGMGIAFRPMHALSRGKARVPACGLPPGLPDGAVPALRSAG